MNIVFLAYQFIVRHIWNQTYILLTQYRLRIDVYNFQWSIIQFLSASIFTLPIRLAVVAAAVILHIHDSHTITWNTLCGIVSIPFPLPTTSHPTAVLIKSYIRAHFGSVVHVCDDVECYEKPIYTYIETCVYDFKYIECMHAHKHYTAGWLNTDVSCALWCGQFISFHRQVFVHYMCIYIVISHYCKKNKERAAVDVVVNVFTLLYCIVRTHLEQRKRKYLKKKTTKQRFAV